MQSRSELAALVLAGRESWWWEEVAGEKGCRAGLNGLTSLSGCRSKERRNR